MEEGFPGNLCKTPIFHEMLLRPCIKIWFTIFLILNLGTEILNGDNHKYFSQDHSNLLQILSFTYLLIYFFY